MFYENYWNLEIEAFFSWYITDEKNVMLTTIREEREVKKLSYEV